MSLKPSQVYTCPLASRSDAPRESRKGARERGINQIEEIRSPWRSIGRIFRRDHVYFFEDSLAALMSGANVLRGSAFLKNACCNNSEASGRFSASTSKVLAK